MESLVGPVIALLLGMKFTHYSAKKNAKAIADLKEKTELVSIQQSSIEEQIPKKMMATLLPVAKAVAKLNTQVGIK